MNKLNTKDIAGTLSVLQSDHSIVALCGSGGTASNLLQWEHWLTLSGLVVLPQSVYPASPSREEMGMLSFMRIQKIMKSDALVVITTDGKDGPTVFPDDMQLIIVALHAGKRVFTSTYIGRHSGPDSEDAVFGGGIACPLRSLDLTAPGYLFELSWEDLQARDKLHKDITREMRTLPKSGGDVVDPVKGGSATNGGTHGAVVASQRPTPSEPDGYDPREPLQLTEDAIRQAQQPRRA